jgi:hypothetical protein
MSNSRIKRKPATLTFDFDSQYRRCADIQQAFKSEVITPILCEYNPQDAQCPGAYFSPPKIAMEMIRTKDDIKINGRMESLRK